MALGCIWCATSFLLFFGSFLEKDLTQNVFLFARGFVKLDVVELRLVENTRRVMVAIRIFISDSFYCSLASHAVRIAHHSYLTSRLTGRSRRELATAGHGALVRLKIARSGPVSKRSSRCRIRVQTTSLYSRAWVLIYIWVVRVRWGKVLTRQQEHLFVKATDHRYLWRAWLIFVIGFGDGVLCAARFFHSWLVCFGRYISGAAGKLSCRMLFFIGNTGQLFGFNLMRISRLLPRMKARWFEPSRIRGPFACLLGSIDIGRVSDRLRWHSPCLQMKRRWVRRGCCTVHVVLLVSLVWICVRLRKASSCAVSEVACVRSWNLLLRYHLVLSCMRYWCFICCCCLLPWSHIHTCVRFMIGILLQLNLCKFSLITSNAPISFTDSTWASRSRSKIRRTKVVFVVSLRSSYAVTASHQDCWLSLFMRQPSTGEWLPSGMWLTAKLLGSLLLT
jgi:hypothetical protein